jgi:hypothetical protein
MNVAKKLPDDEDDMQTVSAEWICNQLRIHRYTLTSNATQ